MKLRAMAHSRTGDKGDTSNISVIAYDPRDYEHLRREVTVERVKAHFDAGANHVCVQTLARERHTVAVDEWRALASALEGCRPTDDGS